MNATVVGSRSYVRPNTNDGAALGHYAGVDNSTTNGTSVGARTWVGEMQKMVQH